MSGAYAEYLDARGMVIAAAADLTAAVQRPGRLDDDIRNLLETAVDAAARALEEAVAALPAATLPAGWDDPPRMSGEPADVRKRVTRAALWTARLDLEDSNYPALQRIRGGAERELALACQDLTAELGALHVPAGGAA